MATTVGNAYLQIVPVSKGIQGAITDSINGAAGNAGTSAGKSIISKLVPSFGEAGASGAKMLGGKLIATMGALGVGAAVGKVISQGIQEGAQLEQSLGGVEAIFGDEAAEIVKKNAANAFASVGVSANEYMQGVTSFSAALIRDMGGDTKAAAAIADMAFQDMGDNANRFGKSVEDIQTVYAGLAKGQFQLLDNLSLGFAGSKEGMQDLLKYAGELDGVEYSIDSLADMYTAIHRVQQELKVTGTTADEAASTIEGSKNAMKAAWKDLLGNMAVGGDVQTALANLGTTVRDYLMGNFLPMVFRIVGQLPGALVTGVAEVGAKIIAALPQLLAQLVGSIGNMIISLKDALIGFIPTLAQGFMDMFTNAKDIITQVDWVGVGSSIITSITDGVNFMLFTLPETLLNLGTTAIEWFKSVDWVKVGQDVIEAIKGAWQKGRGGAGKLLGNVGQSASKFFKSIDWVGLGQTVMRFIGNGINKLGQNLPKIMQTIGQTALKLFQSIDWVGLGSKVIKFISNGIIALLNAIPNVLKGIGQTAMTLFSTIDWLGLGKAVIGYIVDGITFVITSIPKVIKGIGETAITWFKQVDWLGLGKAVINLIVSGIKGLITLIPNTLKGIGSSAISLFKGEKWSGAGESAINGISSGVTNTQKSLADKIREAIFGAKDAGEKAAKSDGFNALGKYMITGVAVGIKENSPTVVKAMTDQIDATLMAGERKAIVSSPSKLFRDRLGKYLSLGTAVGIEDYTPTVVQAAKDMIDSAIAAASGIPAALSTGVGGLSMAGASGLSEPIYQIVVQAEIDGTELKTTVADFTINKISNDQLMLMRAQGYGI